MYAEEVESKKTGILQSSDVPLPSNLNDIDLTPSCTEIPAPRIGITEMSLPLLNFEIIRLVGKLSALSSEGESSLPAEGKPESLPQAVTRIVNESRLRVETNILSFCDHSRPFDWLILLFARTIMTKVAIMMHDQSLTTCTADADDSRQDKKMSLSLDVLECQYLVLNDPRLSRWTWAFRNVPQTHALMHVLTDLADRPQSRQAPRAWDTIDLIFEQPDALDGHNLQEPDRASLRRAHQIAAESRLYSDSRVPQRAKNPSSSSSYPRIRLIGGGFGIPALFASHTGTSLPAVERSQADWQQLIPDNLFDVSEDFSFNFEQLF